MTTLDLAALVLIAVAAFMTWYALKREPRR
jgi:hypothetical protein